jgi:hypothetical protein
MQAHLLNLLQIQLCDEYKRITSDVDYWWYGYYYANALGYEGLRSSCIAIFNTSGEQLLRIRGHYIDRRVHMSKQYPLGSDYRIDMNKKAILPYQINFSLGYTRHM